MLAFDGLLKVVVRVTVAPGAIEALLTVTYGAPSWVPLLLSRVTPEVRPSNCTWNGPVIALPLVLVIEIVPVYLPVKRLTYRPDWTTEKPAVRSMKVGVRFRLMTTGSWSEAR